MLGSSRSDHQAWAGRATVDPRRSEHRLRRGIPPATENRDRLSRALHQPRRGRRESVPCSRHEAAMSAGHLAAAGPFARCLSLTFERALSTFTPGHDAWPGPWLETLPTASGEAAQGLAVVAPNGERPTVRPPPRRQSRERRRSALCGAGWPGSLLRRRLPSCHPPAGSASPSIRPRPSARSR
jgi:hypothetical protein